MCGSRGTGTGFRRCLLKVKRAILNIQGICILLACVLFWNPAFGQAPGPVRIRLDQAIQLALQHNHNLQAARTTILQSQSQEITANFRPNPVLFTDWEYLPLVKTDNGLASYLHDNTEADLGVSYLIERGGKRARRTQAARDITAVTRSQVTDIERGLGFQVASLFINVQLAESILDLAQENLKSFQNTVDISDSQFRAGGISEGDNLKIKLQLLQFQTDLQQAQLARMQALSDLRQLLGYESVAPDYDVAGSFDYQPLQVSLGQLQMTALQNRLDLRAIQQSVTAAGSQHLLARANGKQDVVVSANYSHVNGIHASTFYLNIPIPLFNRNQGEIARTRYAITQVEEQQKALSGQVMTDVKDAYEGLQTSSRVAQFYRSGYLDTSQKNRDISEYAYQRGAARLLDFLDAERSYRATQVAYRQALAAYLLALEQVRQAVGTRTLP
jgi:cobalt-zinc-cadmium efflux system outer membrane protein